MTDIKKLLNEAFKFNEAKIKSIGEIRLCDQTGAVSGHEIGAFIDGARQQQRELSPLAKEIIMELVETMRFYGNGGNFNRDLWYDNDLGFFTGKRAKEALAKVEARLKQTYGAEG